MVPIVRFIKAAIAAGAETWVDLTHRYVEHETHPHSKKLLRVALFSWFLAYTLVLLPRHAEFFSPSAYFVQTFEPVNWQDWVTSILRHPAVRPHYRWFIVGQLITLALAIVGYRPRLTACLAFLFTINLNRAAELTMDGGNNLSWLIATYMLFMNTDGRRRSHATLFGYIDTSLSNVAFLLMRLQLVAMYLFAGWCKVTGVHWQSGLSIFYILQLENYSHPTLGSFMVKHWWVSVAGSYFTVAFQTAFPLLIWLRRARPYLFASGILLHSMIFVVMGLPAFALVMVIAYIAFFTDAWSRGILEFFRPSTSLELAYDEQCSLCQKFARVGLWFGDGSIDNSGARGPRHEALRAIDERERLARLHAVDGAGRIFVGYDAIEAIIARTPIVRFARPLFWLAGFVGLGGVVYAAVASWTRKSEGRARPVLASSRAVPARRGSRGSRP